MGEALPGGLRDRSPDGSGGGEMPEGGRARGNVRAGEQPASLRTQVHEMLSCLGPCVDACGGAQWSEAGMFGGSGSVDAAGAGGGVARGGAAMGAPAAASGVAAAAQSWVREELQRRVQAQMLHRQAGEGRGAGGEPGGARSAGVGEGAAGASLSYAERHARQTCLSGRPTPASRGVPAGDWCGRAEQAGCGGARGDTPTRAPVESVPAPAHARPPSSVPDEHGTSSYAPPASGEAGISSYPPRSAPGGFDSGAAPTRLDEAPSTLGPISTLLRSVGRSAAEGSQRYHYSTAASANAGSTIGGGAPVDRPSPTAGAPAAVPLAGIASAARLPCAAAEPTVHPPGMASLEPLPAAGTEETVLRMLKQADAARWAEARRAEELELEMRERAAVHEVQMHDAQLENLEVGAHFCL